MTRSLLAGLGLACGLAATLSAQAPRITPAGDPTVQNDSIYALAVDPSRYPEEDYVVLFDDGVDRVESDGRVTRTYRQVIELLTDNAVERFSERSYTWAPETEKFRLNWIRVVRPDGTVISPGPAQQQESDVPIPTDDPVYAKRKELRITMSGVAKGTIVDASYTTEATKVWLPGDFRASWSVHNAVPTRRSRWVLDYPTSMRLHLVETNLTFRPRRVTSGGRTTLSYVTSEVEHLKPQQFATDTGPRFMSIAASGPVTWADIGAWYRGLAAPRTTLGPATSAAIHAHVAGATTLLDSIRAIHHWVSEDIRYVSLSLGDGGYQPRAPDDVVQAGFGDCKDKATLFVVAMQAFGLPARTVLLGAEGVSDPRLPSISQFDHAIAEVTLPTGKVYSDLTAGMVPFGELPVNLEDQLGVAVGVTGAIDTVRIPESRIADNRTIQTLVGTIDTAGRIRGAYVLEKDGASAYRMRSNYAAQFDSTDRDHLGRTVVQDIYPGAVYDSIVLFDGKDLTATPRVRFTFHDGRALRRSGRSWILPNPLGTMEELDQSADEVEREGTRWAPIALASANGLVTVDNDIQLTLPPGWRPVLPPDVHVSSDIGTYDATYRFEDGVFKAHRHMGGARGALPPARISDVVKYFRDVAADNTPLITLEVPAH